MSTGIQENEIVSVDWESYLFSLILWSYYRERLSWPFELFQNLIKHIRPKFVSNEDFYLDIMAATQKPQNSGETFVFFSFFFPKLEF